SQYLKAVHQQHAISSYWKVPSVFWMNSGDFLIQAAALLGVAVAIAGLVGFAQGWMLLLCYLLYLSYTVTGQEFMSFQWDALLLEVGFVALFAAPWTFKWEPFVAREPHWLVPIIFMVILFKLMFLSGAVKILSGDGNWRNLSALSYHYWTQP